MWKGHALRRLILRRSVRQVPAQTMGQRLIDSESRPGDLQSCALLFSKQSPACSPLLSIGVARTRHILKPTREEHAQRLPGSMTIELGRLLPASTPLWQLLCRPDDLAAVPGRVSRHLHALPPPARLPRA